MTWALYSTPSWLGTVSSSVSAACDGLVLLELLDEHVGLGGVAAAEDRARVLVDDADLVFESWPPRRNRRGRRSVDQREDAAADRHPRLARHARPRSRPRGRPRICLRLLDVERLAGLVVLQRRALQVRCRAWPPRRSSRSSPTPHQIRSRRPGECGSSRNRPGGFGEHRPRVRLRETFAAQNLEQRPRCGLPRHVGVALAVGRRVAEVAPAVDHLLGRAPADPELQPAAGDQIGRPGVLGHVQRVLVAHVDDGGADLDPLSPRADGRQQRERRGELAREMVDAEVRAVGAQLLRRDRELDRLQQRIGAPSASATAARASSGRRRGSRSFS